MTNNKIKDCATQLRRVWPLIKQDFESKFKGWKIKITCGHRPPECQLKLYKKGRTYNKETRKWELTHPKQRVTNRDGTERMSDHNYWPSKAFDVALRNPQSDYTWNTALPQWKYMEPLAKKYGVLNGSNWKAFTDMPHFYIT